jgi:hypothetical protein
MMVPLTSMEIPVTLGIVTSQSTQSGEAVPILSHHSYHCDQD